MKQEPMARCAQCRKWFPKRLIGVAGRGKCIDKYVVCSDGCLRNYYADALAEKPLPTAYNVLTEKWQT